MLEYARLMSREEAIELNLVAHLTTDDHAKIGRMPTCAFTWADSANKRMDRRDYLRRLAVSRARQEKER